MSTSRLQIEVGDLLDKTFPEYHIRENYHPDWLISSNLTRLELDFYIEELKIAFEIQGQQHYEFIPYFFKTYSEFEKRQLYDEEKRDLCYGVGVKLIEADSLFDIKLEINRIKGVRKEYPDEFLELQLEHRKKLREFQAKREEELVEQRKTNQIINDIKHDLKIIRTEETKKQNIVAEAKKKELYLQDPAYRLIKNLRLAISSFPENDKILEIRRFCKKLERFCKSNGKASEELFIFGFQCLDIDEQNVLLDGLTKFNIQYKL